MTDIVDRLRTWFHAVDAVPVGDLLDEAADEIVRLRGSLMELGACVRTAETLDEAISSANRHSPLSVDAVLMQGFRAIDAMWRKCGERTPQSGCGTPAGNTQEPVAWAVVSDSTEQIDCEFVYPDKATAGDVALDSNGGVVPLYRQPQPTLTNAEREAVLAMACHCDTRSGLEWVRLSATLRGLLERLGGGR